MQIFYTDISEYIDNLKSKSEIKKLQHKYSKILLEKVAKEYYGIEDTSVVKINKKPKFVNSNLNFSISHSENIIVIGFDVNEIGIDIEKIIPRDFAKLALRYKLDKVDEETFYKFWTQYEAKIKLQTVPKRIFTQKFLNDYMLTVAGDFEEKYKIVKINHI